MEILTKPKPWHIILKEITVGGDPIYVDYSDAASVRKAINRETEGEYTTDKVEVTITNKTTGVEENKVYLMVTRLA